MCNDCTFIALNPDRLAIVKMTLIGWLVTANDRRKTPVKFCVKITQKRASAQPNWLPNEKNIGQVHLVYHIPLNGGKFWQAARQETGIGFGPVAEQSFVYQARLAPNGFRQNEQSENE